MPEATKINIWCDKERLQKKPDVSKVKPPVANTLTTEETLPWNKKPSKNLKRKKKLKREKSAVQNTCTAHLIMQGE